MSRSAHWPSGATSARRARWPVPLGIAFLLASASGASAQGPSLTAPDSTWLVQDSVARACLDTLSDGSARPVTAYQIATASDTSRTVLDAEQQAVRAEVIMGIVVRPGGHADGAVRSVVISSRASIGSGARAHFAQEFTSVVEGIVKRMRFEPARVGGCAVPQQADFPFSFFRG